MALQALAAVLGGTQSLHTNSMDEALALPSEKAVTIALRTQQVIADESGVASTVDPLGGSFFVEALTDRMEREANDYFRRIEALGGVIPAIEAGFMQREIAEAAFRYQQEIDSGRAHHRRRERLRGRRSRRRSRSWRWIRRATSGRSPGSPRARRAGQRRGRGSLRRVCAMRRATTRPT